jgi:TusA-related sulfurtransferase
MADGKHFVLDVKGLFSPLANLKTIQVYNKMEPGDTLCVEHIDPESIDDLITILKKYPLHFSGPMHQDGRYVLQLTKIK